MAKKQNKPTVAEGAEPTPKKVLTIADIVDKMDIPRTDFVQQGIDAIGKAVSNEYYNVSGRVQDVSRAFPKMISTSQKLAALVRKAQKKNSQH